MKRIVILVVVGFLVTRAPLFANETMESIINKQIERLDLSEIEKATADIEEFNLKETMLDAITGNHTITPASVIKNVLNLVFWEMDDYINLMGRLIILALFSTIVSALGTSFSNKSISEIAFYVCYMVLIITLAESFRISMNIAYKAIEQMVVTMKFSIPVMITLLVSTGNVASGSLFQPIVISSIQIGAAVIKNMVLPLVFFVSVLQIVSNISEDFKIDTLIDLAYGSIKWILRGILTLFIGVMGIYGLTTPFVDGTLNKAAKSMTAAFVPVVGDALSGTIDLVMNCGVIVKNSYSVGIIIALIMICAVPLIQIFLCMVVYQLSAAIIQPISDGRITNSMRGMGKATGYLLGTLTTVMVLFILNMLILVGVGNITAMMR